MHERTLRAATAFAVLAGGTSLILGTPAQADSAKVLPVSTVGEMVVDPVHQRVFLSDPKQGKVIETGYDGTVKATNDGVAGAFGLALSADGEQLYAAAPHAHAIVSLSTDGLTTTASYPTGDETNPEHVAVAGGRVWFGYTDPTASESGNIGSLDLSGDEPVVTLAQGGTGWYGGPMLAVAANDPNRLAAVETHLSTGALAIFDVSGGTATQTARVTDDSPRDVALSPDGSTLATVASGDYVVSLRNTSDLSVARRLPIEPYPVAVDIATDGMIAGGSMSWYDPDLHIFTPTGTTPIRQYDLPDTGADSGADTLVDGALAWEPGGDRLFAVSSNDRGVLSLRMFSTPKKSVPTVTLTAPGKATRAKAFTLSGTVTASVPLPAGTPLTVTRTDLDSPNGKSLGTRTLGANGAYSFTDTPPAGGTVTYKVAFAGDATHTGASATRSVSVSRTTPTLTLDRNNKIYAYGTTVSMTAHLGATYKNRTVEIWADPYGSDQANKLLKRATVNSKGNVSVNLRLTRTTAVTAVYTGDSRTAAKTVKSTVKTKVNVSTAISRQYKTAKIGSTTYYWFHAKTDPAFTTTMTAYPGRSQKLMLEFYYQGKWRDGGSESFKLDSKGKSYVTLTGTHDKNLHMRVRAAYVTGSSGDSVNYTTYGSYKYFVFTS